MMMGTLLCLTACGPAPESVRYSPPPELDARLQGLYDASCATCHTNDESGAPKLGDTQAWDDRWAKGYDTLLDHTIIGYNAMPALGGCAGCSREDLKILVQYLGGRCVLSDPDQTDREEG